ncbi:MAG: hypothetical protein A2X82_18275 [Geobacteraceae bacterium GWC2_55_20]|nr:MAG: hypothetical protein A2X82_18275 [Geobacteraceae bacterium GWC2_55_20]OGU26353.1 MAG: hypothetical protein A2X85_15895 [Geobacteraceae bacterium GWF2_54_21]HBA70813.1 hypothetical protein [Geobacter sp.]HCE68117.1 hypothetical protein [Geobacter sp.]
MGGVAKTTGHFITTATAGEQFKAFVPDPLPAQSALDLNARHFELMEKANWALGRLDGVAASKIPVISAAARTGLVAPVPPWRRRSGI